MGRSVVTIAAALAVCGCSHVLSSDIRQEVDATVTFSDLQNAPDAFRGRTVLLGGVIVATENGEDGTLMEVYQTEMNTVGEPVRVDQSGGRFLAFYGGFLDGEIYRKGRKVTMAGVVQGAKMKRLGELSYRYPYLMVRELHLWKEENTYPYGVYGRGRPDPWWGYPYYRPYGPYPPYGFYWY